MWRRRRENAAESPAIIEIALVHRPKHGDWSLPKGKRKARDRDLRACAVREVEEETGFEVEVGDYIADSRYAVGTPRGAQALKLVRYWLMRTVSGEFRPHAEVDDLRWLRPEDAAQLLTHDGDREVLEAALSILAHEL